MDQQQYDGQQQQSHRRPTRKQVLWIVGIAAVFAVAVGYSFGITLWDWIQLLIVPAVIAGGGLWFNAQQQVRQRQIEERRAQDEALQAYLNEMSKLLIEHRLRTPKPDKEPDKEPDEYIHENVRAAAQAQTLTILTRLDGARKGIVLRFLRDSGLIATMQRRVLSLERADLSEACLSGDDLGETDLIYANLSCAYLDGADLGSKSVTKIFDEKGQAIDALSWREVGAADIRGGDLSKAHLKYASLNGTFGRGAQLIGADLQGAIITGAYLQHANLNKANLQEADLTNAHLRHANLKGAKVTDEQLIRAKSLEGATMPNGQKYEDWLKSKDREENAKNDGSS